MKRWGRMFCRQANNFAHAEFRRPRRTIRRVAWYGSEHGAHTPRRIAKPRRERGRDVRHHTPPSPS